MTKTIRLNLVRQILSVLPHLARSIVHIHALFAVSASSIAGSYAWHSSIFDQITCILVSVWMFIFPPCIPQTIWLHQLRVSVP